ncbi:MAG: glycerophosphodiester phosphodiesterase [Candidatus Thermoplasmatota archaeon]|nr:glycerophosphodiester phosphodiesterase [Candidatus Thermoplasmatota archaeon]
MSAIDLFLSPATDGRRPFIVGHRGASGLAPENTLSSFSLAIEMGADAIEFDVHQTSDGHPVVIHDELLDRTTDGKGMVNSTDIKTLRKLDAGSWFSSKFRGEKVPTLEEALELVCRNNIAVVEIKHGSEFYEGIEERIVNAVESESRWKERTVFIAFNPSLLQKISELDNELKTGLLIVDPPEEYLEILDDFGITSVFPRWEKMKAESVHIAHRKGYSVHPWVVDREEDARKLIELRPDSISSNYPNMLSGIIGRSDAS